MWKLTPTFSFFFFFSRVLKFLQTLRVVQSNEPIRDKLKQYRDAYNFGTETGLGIGDDENVVNSVCSEIRYPCRSTQKSLQRSTRMLVDYAGFWPEYSSFVYTRWQVPAVIYELFTRKNERRNLQPFADHSNAVKTNFYLFFQRLIYFTIRTKHGTPYVVPTRRRRPFSYCIGNDKNRFLPPPPPPPEYFIYINMFIKYFVFYRFIEYVICTRHAYLLCIPFPSAPTLPVFRNPEKPASIVASLVLRALVEYTRVRNIVLLFNGDRVKIFWTKREKKKTETIRPCVESGAPDRRWPTRPRWQM